MLQKRESGELIDRSKFLPEDLAKIEEIKKGFNIDNSDEVIGYGVGAQREISDFSDTILDQVRSKDSGFVGEVLTDLMVTVKDIDVDSLSTKGSFMASLPIIGDMMDKAKRFIARYDKLSVQIEKIIEELEKARMNLLKDITLLDNLYGKNLSYLKNLDIYIAAGEDKIEELNTTVLPQYKQKADQTNDPADAQRYHDLSQLINRFEKKLHDLKLSRMISIQTAPQVRLIQNGDQVLVEKIQSSILNTIPLWKNQIVIAITLFRQDKALKLQKEISETTNNLLKKNSEMLKDGTIEVAKESERGIVEIETLKKVNNDLLSTIEETIKIQQEGKTKRKNAEVELIKLESELKTKLKEVKSQP
ncbi:MAG: toxic anion resistance protein [Spirochaetes bacterium]|nr:toxic anion resistance protein [Spirochaetota bacterium]MBN2771812.1 toxic anion resistance protein [Spirochaetota bacterium]